MTCVSVRRRWTRRGRTIVSNASHSTRPIRRTPAIAAIASIASASPSAPWPGPATPPYPRVSQGRGGTLSGTDSPRLRPRGAVLTSIVRVAACPSGARCDMAAVVGPLDGITACPWHGSLAPGGRHHPRASPTRAAGRPDHTPLVVRCRARAAAGPPPVPPAPLRAARRRGGVPGEPAADGAGLSAVPRFLLLARAAVPAAALSLHAAGKRRLLAAPRGGALHAGRTARGRGPGTAARRTCRRRREPRRARAEPEPAVRLAADAGRGAGARTGHGCCLARYSGPGAPLAGRLCRDARRGAAGQADARPGWPGGPGAGVGAAAARPRLGGARGGPGVDGRGRAAGAGRRGGAVRHR